MFNPITNQPMDDYKIKKEQIQKEREKEMQELYNAQLRKDKYDVNIKNNNINKKEQIPREYNPYKNPYSAYQGHP
jgi:hypothetical protein